MTPMTPTISKLLVNANHSKDFDAYIGREDRRIPSGSIEGADGYFGNPYTVKVYGREGCLKRYRIYFYDRLKTDAEFKQRILGLKDKRLGCWCSPEPCHGDIILEYLSTVEKEQESKSNSGEWLLDK